jgi:hypothetical protein
MVRADSEGKYASVACDPGDGGAGGRLGLVAVRDEHQAHRVPALSGQFEARGGAQERVGDLQEYARAVARVRLGARGAAVLEVAQRGERLLHDPVAGLAGEGGYEGDPASVLLGPGIIKTLSLRQSAEECAWGLGGR